MKLTFLALRSTIVLKAVTHSWGNTATTIVTLRQAHGCNNNYKVQRQTTTKIITGMFCA